MTIFMEFMMRPAVTSQFLICPPEVAFDGTKIRNVKSTFGQHFALEVFKWIVETCYWGKAGSVRPIKKCHFREALN